MTGNPSAPEQRYDDPHKLAQGAMGAVFRAHDRVLGREVVLKLLAISGGGDEEWASPGAVHPPGRTDAERADYARHRARFEREARIAAQLEHPGVVPVYDLGETARGVPFQVLRMIRTETTLADVMTKAGTASWSRRRALLEPFLDVCDTMAYAHANGVVHRDLKPQNIMVGDFGQVFVVDWGLAQAIGTAGTSPISDVTEGRPVDAKTGLSGTPGYIAPEVLLGHTRDPDPRQDVYALGVLLYEILTARSPYPQTTLADYVRWVEHDGRPSFADLPWELPEALVACCRAALERSPERRVPDVASLAASIRQWQEDETVGRLALRVEAEMQAARDAPLPLRPRLLDRAAANLDALRRSGGDERTVQRLHQDVERLREDVREAALREQRRTWGRRLAIGALAFLVVAGGLVSVTLERRRKEARDAYAEADTARGQAEAALDLAVEARQIAVNRARLATSYALVSLSREMQDVDPTLAYALARRAARAVEPALDRAVVRLRGAMANLKEVRRTPVSDVAIASGLRLGGRSGVALGDVAGGVSRWTPDGERLGVAEEHRGVVRALATGADGWGFVSGGDDGVVRRWSADGQAHDAVGTLEAPVRAVAVLADGAVVAGAADGSLVLWRAGEDPRRLPPHAGGTNAVVAMPDGAGFVSGGQDGIVRAWSNSGEIAATFGDGVDASPVLALAVAASDGAVLVGAEDGSATLWSPAGEVEAVFRAHTGPVRAVAFARDDRVVLTGSDDRTARAWDRAGTPLEVYRGHVGGIVALLVAPEGDGFQTASTDGTLRTWLWHGHDVATLTQPDDPILDVVFGGTANALVTVAAHSVRVHDEAGGTDRPTVTLPQDGCGWLAASADARRAAAVCQDGAVRLLLQGRPPLRMPSPTGDAPTHAVLLPGEASLVAAYPSGEVVAWQRDRIAASWVRETKEDPLRALDVSASGKRVALGTERGRVVVREVADGAIVRTWSLGGPVQSLAFSPDGTRLAMVAAGRPVRVALVEGALTWPYAEDVENATALAWAAGGDLLLVGTSDGTATLRSAEGRARATFPSPDGALAAVALSPDGTRVATLSQSGIVRLWHATVEGLLEEAARRPPRPLTPAERERYRDVLNNEEAERTASRE